MRLKDMLRRVAATLILACAAPALAAAEVRITGNIDHSVLVAKNATMSEIVYGMQSVLNCKITLKGLTKQHFSGIYSGSARQVLTRLLRGADYVMFSDRDQITIVLGGADGGRAGTRNTSDVEGWTGQPSELPARANPTAATNLTAAANPEPANSPDVQGWTDQPSELPARARPSTNTSLNAAANPEFANSSDVEGWTGQPSELLARARPSANAGLSAAANPEPTNYSDIQGWMSQPFDFPARADRGGVSGARQ